MMAANKINRRILQELSDGPKVLEKGLPEAQITPQGHELLFVAFEIERWLQKAPGGIVEFGSDAAKSAVRAFVDGWSTTMIHTLAVEPLSLAELNRAADVIRRRSLKRHLNALERLGQVEARPSEDGRYAVTDWLRRGIAPLAVASRWERRHTPDETVPIDGLDVGAAFLLTLPLLDLPPTLSGSCRLRVEFPAEEGTDPAGAIARIEGGRIASCSAGLAGEADSWAVGTTFDWLDAVIDGDPDRIECGGNDRLPRTLLEQLHEVLYGLPLTGSS
jgi:DNA-binding HxlR family transcriptional regulator